MRARVAGLSAEPSIVTPRRGAPGVKRRSNPFNPPPFFGAVRAPAPPAAGAPRGGRSYRTTAAVKPPIGTAEEEALNRLLQAQEGCDAPETLRALVDQKREIFMAQLAIDTKREELQRLTQLEREEEECLRAKEAEISLVRDQFRGFCESDAKATMDAREAAENKTRQRLEVAAEIRDVSTKIAALRHAISHDAEQRREWDGFGAFLESLTPAEWRRAHPSPALHFTRPRQLLDILDALQDDNAFLMALGQEAEEAVTRSRERFNGLLDARDGALTEMADRRTLRARELHAHEDRNERYRAPREFRMGNELSDDEHAELQRSILEFHAFLGFGAVVSSDTELMLRRIEERMREVALRLTDLRASNPALLKELAQAKETKRRDQEREERNARAKKETEDRTQRVIQLALAPIKRRGGRVAVRRTVPWTEGSREKREEEARRRLAQEARDSDLLYGTTWD